MELKRVETDLVILGAGIAGLSSAIYARRARLNTIVIDESMSGGQVATTEEVANYPGVGIVKGPDLMENVRKQAEYYETQIDEFKKILEVNVKGNLKYIKTEDTEYYAKALIIATGSEPRPLSATGAQEFKGKGVHYCATCDGFMYRDKNVMVIGGGDAALEEGVFLTRLAKEVTIVHRREEFRASKLAQEEAMHNHKIKFILNSEILEVKGDKFVNTAVLRNTKTNEITEVPTDGLFVYIGMEPKTKFFVGQLDMDDTGYILAGEDTKTSVPGVFAAGDVRKKLVRQAVTAAADGAVAAIMAEKYVALLK